MKKLTFREYLIELMVSDDPMQALKDVRKAKMNPDRFNRQQRATNVEDQRAIQQKQDDPLKTEKLRVSKMKQQLAMNEKRLREKQERAEKLAGVAK